MTKQRVPSCKTCKYYKYFNDMTGEYSTGKCLRYPPRIISTQGFANREQFPEVHVDLWCGEHTLDDC